MGVSNAWGEVVLRYQKDMPSDNYDGNTSKTMTQSSANSNRYYCEISLTANSSYGFFIINGNNYYKVNVTATSNNSVQLYDYGSENYGKSNHRVTYQSGTAGTYIFTYDASNHKICVSPKSSETIKIAYDVAQGHDGDWNLNNYVNLTQVGSTANYTIDLDLQAKKYYMFVQISNGIYWRAGSTLNVDGSASLYYYGTTNYGESSDKINFTPSTAGKYRFTWNHQDKTIKLEPFYSVTYNGNSHTSGSVPATSQHLKGSTVTVASNSGNLARTGYTFSGWNTNSTGTGTNYTAGSGSFTMGSSNTTLYAKWNENKYNVVINTEGNGTTNQTGTKSIGVVGIDIIATPNIGYAFKQWKVTGGAQVADATSASTKITATAAGTVTAVFEEYRKSTNGTTIWNQTADLTLPSDNETLYEIKSTGNGTETKATGEWKAANFNVTLEKTAYGKYAIELNGLKYYSSQTEDVVIKNVPLESTLKLVSAESFNTAYNNNMCIQAHDGADFEAIAIDANHTICGTTVIKENFSTLAAHTVYLRVPTSGETATNWNATGANYIYTHNHTDYKVVTSTTPTDEEIYKESGYNYYKFVIPAGCRTFRFERKTAQNVAATYVTESFTRYLPFEMTNCYTIEGRYINDQNTFYGSWGMSLANGDYRLLYVEQVVTNGDGNDSWKTVIKNTYQHSSDIIKKRTDTGTDKVSLHINYDETKHPRIILQQFSNGNWVDVEDEARMAVGPLTADPGRAMLQGRRNTESLTHDDGIEEIKQDKAVNGYAGRVWNFTVQQTVDNGNVTANLLFDPINAMEGSNLEPYSGNYYIRTDNAEGGWMDYTIPANHMHFSQYALENSGFSHYFCKWVETSKKQNTKFVIANDYGAAISDTFSEDQFTDQYGNIQENANIRWSWNEYTNEVARAYIQGAYNGKAQNENILLDYTTDGKTETNDVILFDTGDWIYSIDVEVEVGSTLKSITATYPKITHTIDSKTINPIIQTFEEGLPMLTGGESANTYTVRVLYDFKIDKTLVALVPNEHKAEIAIDVMIERINQEKPATQVRADITYTNNQRSGEGSTVYAVMSFTKDHLTNEKLSNEEKLTYWFSVPFNVKLSDVFGFGEVGQYWMIKYYDGDDRADKGLLDDNTFWKFITKKSTVLQANTGYVLALNKKVMDPNSPIFTNTNKISLYFPSTEPIQMIGTGYTVENCTILPHTCTLPNREIYDSNWNFIGVPSYADKNKTTTNENVKYFYDYNHASDSYTVAENGREKTFNSMFAYMVQFAGTINWKTFTFTKNGAQGLAAKRNTDSDAKQHNLRLELQQNGATADKTFIQLQDEDATEMFDMNSDLCKIINAGSNIYSIISTESTPVNVAGNVLPIQETIIPLGVVSAASGEYTFAMPDGTDGIVVELIDYETNTRTNMLLDEYTVNLGKGTFENRFALHVKPDKTTTSVDNIGNEATGDKVKKYLIDGVLYMQKDGVLYDAQGRCVQ